MSKKSTLTRRIVLEILENTHRSGDKLGVFLRNVLDKYDYLEQRDKAFIKYMTEGVVRYQIKLDYVIDNYASVKGKMKPLIRLILRMGVFQILYMDQVPDSAACNEAVNLAFDRGQGALKGFVNGVLRNISRQKEDIKWPDDISVIYSTPRWLCDYIVENYGDEKTRIILDAGLHPSDLVIRVRDNLSKETIEATIKAISESDVVIEKHPYLASAYILKNVSGMYEVPGFKEGYITVQDVSSQFIGYLSGIKKGDYVIDMCAAPGGKSIHAADLVMESGKVEARDVSEAKTSLIDENIMRMGVDNVSTLVYDATVMDESIIEKADVVICDVPCSGIGVMGRKSDIKYNITADSINELSKLQRKIVTNAAAYVKKGGILMYSTCTISKEENDINRQYIIDNLPLRPVSFEDKLPEELKGATGKDGYLQLLQGINKCDGFFIAKFEKY